MTTWTFNLCTAWSGACYNWDNGYYRIDQSNRDSAGTQLNWVATFHDPWDRMVDRAALNRDGNQVNERWIYDTMGRLSSQSTPARLSAGDSFFYASFTFDLAGRVTQASRPVSDSDPTAQTITTYYEGLTSRVVDALGKQNKQIANALGQVVRSIDPDNYYQNVDYDAFGNAVRVQDSAGATLQTGTYNVRGLRTASTNVDLGSWSYGYNALGEMTSYTDANSKTITQTFDALGRPLTRVMPEGGGSITSTWTWGTSAGAHEIGRVKSQQISGTGIATYSETFSFDSLGRPSQTQYAENGNTYTVNQTYSTLTGFVDTLTYPTSTSGYQLKLQYDYQNGALWKVKDYNAPSTVFWQANAANARGQVTEQVLGNGLKTVRSFDQVTGWVDYIQTGPGGGTSVQNLAYLWDKAGNLAQRQDNNQGLTENAYYDNLYRLDYTTLNGSTNLDLSYAANGNIQSQSGVGTYTYHGTKLHAVASINTGGGTWSFGYDNNGNMTNRNGTTLAWYASNLPKSITKDSQNSSTFQYTPSGQRWQHAYQAANVTYTHVYVGGLLEKVTEGSTVDWKHYLFAEGQAVALYSRKSSGTNTLSYLLRDHQGSVEVITSSAGAVIVRESFNAYGQRRGTAWSGSPSAGDLTTINGLTRRGYTGHEMLDSTALVHMNGRVYDPLIARFVSADPYLDTKFGTQAWNIFAYVGGNPLSFTDPSGFTGEKERFRIKYTNAPSPGETECARHPTTCGGWSTLWTGNEFRMISMFMDMLPRPSRAQFGAGPKRSTGGGEARNGHGSGGADAPDNSDDATQVVPPLQDPVSTALVRVGDFFCENPAVSAGLQFQLNAGFWKIFGFEGQVSLVATTHGQLVWTQSGGGVVGINQGLVVSGGIQAGATTDAPTGFSRTSSVGVEYIAGAGLEGFGYGTQVSTDGSGVSTGTSGKGSFAIGGGVVAGVSRQEGLRLATGTLCGFRE